MTHINADSLEFSTDSINVENTQKQTTIPQRNATGDNRETPTTDAHAAT